MGQQRHYPSLNGLRTISCIAIIIMHICANVDYAINDFFYTYVIDSWKWLVYLFMIISSFGLCCGYLEKFYEQSFDIEIFYKRRYQKIIPFFSLLIIMNLVIEPSLNNFSEAFLELTLTHGLLPNNALNVVGVGWFLGTIFVFYMIFPFFSVLMRTRCRAWMTFFITVGINFVCAHYFYTGENVTSDFIASHNFLYCTPFFALGGLLYQYKEKIVTGLQRFRILSLLVCLFLIVGYYLTPNSVKNMNIVPYKALILFAAWLMYAISFDSKVLNNRFTSFISSISLEMYLAQMIVFRIIEKLNLLHLFSNERLCLFVVIILEMVLLIGFVVVCRYLLQLVEKMLKKHSDTA